MAEIQIRQLTAEENLILPESLSVAATFTALDSWTQLVQEIYIYDVYRFVALEENQTVGILALTHVRHPIFGNYLGTAPFGSFGGFAFSSTEARDALLAEATKLADLLKVEYAVVRFIEETNSPPAPWVGHPLYSSYQVDISPDAEEMMRGFGPQHRKHTRQSLRKGFQVCFGHLDLLDDTYEAMARSMHQLGSPYHSKNYLSKMANLLGDTLEFVVVKDAHGVLAGTAVVIYQGGIATTLHANILPEFRNEYAGECLYWSVLEHCAQKEIRVCDFGRSLNGSGNAQYKMKWNPRKVPLAYWYYLPKGGAIPELNQKSPKFQFAIWVWKRLPAFAVRLLGPALIKGII